MTAALVFAPSPQPESRPRPVAADPSGSAPAAARTASPEVYRRRQLAVVAVVAGLILGLASFGRQADATPTPEADAASAVQVVVQPGDTLWAIAEDLAPGTDVRPLVAELSELTGGGSLQPGQLITVPGSLLD